MSEEENKAHWSLFLAGNHEAYSWLYNKYVQVLYRYGQHLTSDGEMIKDCIQEVFANLYRSRKSLPTPANVKVYLIVSLKNSLLRRMHRESVYDRNKDAHSGGFLLEPGVEERFIDDESQRAVEEKIVRLLAVLTPRQREIMYYRYIQEMEFEEICSVMELSYQSAQNLIQRSMKRIRESFGRGRSD
ncbi:MAG: sigma-70 family RNA polymerase sigma factor [Tannerellaceae bacterium]|nr:sigma-70 family RNA polymerase sigma factor [Tannerellaceae bacterium]